MNKERPVNLDLGAFRWPITALASITHRISGVALFFGVGFLIWAMGASLESEESFRAVQECLDGFFPTMIMWAILAGLIYHFVAGVKHLLMDTIVDETFENAMLASKVTIGVSAVLILIAGVWIW